MWSQKSAGKASKDFVSFQSLPNSRPGGMKDSKQDILTAEHASKKRALYGRVSKVNHGVCVFDGLQ
jgi:hypothetical protein